MTTEHSDGPDSRSLDRKAAKEFIGQYRRALKAVDQGGKLRRGKVGIIEDPTTGVELRIRHPERNFGFGRKVLRVFTGRSVDTFVSASVELIRPLEDNPVELSVHGIYTLTAEAKPVEGAAPMDAVAALALFHSIDLDNATVRKAEVMELASSSNLEREEARLASEILRPLFRGETTLPPRITHNNAGQRIMAELTGEEVPPLVSVRRNDDSNSKKYNDGRITIYDPQLEMPYRHIDFQLPLKDCKEGAFHIRDASGHYVNAPPAERRQLIAVLKDTLNPEVQSPDMNAEQGHLPPEDVVRALPEVMKGGSRVDAEMGTLYSYTTHEDMQIYSFRDPRTKREGKIMLRLLDKGHCSLMAQTAEGRMYMCIPIDPQLAQDPINYNLMLWLPLGAESESPKEKLLATVFGHIRRIGNGSIAQ